MLSLSNTSARWHCGDSTPSWSPSRYEFVTGVAIDIHTCQVTVSVYMSRYVL